MRYAQILNGKVHWIFEDEMTLEEIGPRKFNLNQIELIDISAADFNNVREGFDYDGVNFTDPNVLTLDEAKARYIAAAKAYRDTQEVEAITYNGNTYDYDAKARERLNIARQALEDLGTESISWTTADNTDVTLTVADFAAINSVAATRSNTLHVAYRATKAKLEAAESIDELEQIYPLKG